MYLDSHVHMWRRADGDHIWLTDKIGGLNRDFTEDDWQRHADASGVGGVILVQATHSLTEAERWLKKAERIPRLVGVVGWADLHAANLADVVAAQKAYKKFVGIRPLPPDTFGADWIEHPQTRIGLDTLRKSGVACDILVKWPALNRLARLLRDFRDMKLVLNHCGRPDTMTGVLEPWASDLKAFARETTAVVKCSGLVERAGIEWTKESLRPYVQTVIEAFGPDRVMFSTNWPVLEICGTYEGWVRTLTEILGDMGMSAEDKTRIMSGTACRTYGVAVPKV
jgi:L-fuconolactonase